MRVPFTPVDRKVADYAVQHWPSALFQFLHKVGSWRRHRQLPAMAVSLSKLQNNVCATLERSGVKKKRKQMRFLMCTLFIGKLILVTVLNCLKFWVFMCLPSAKTLAWTCKHMLRCSRLCQWMLCCSISCRIAAYLAI